MCMILVFALMLLSTGACHALHVNYHFNGVGHNDLYNQAARLAITKNETTIVVDERSRRVGVGFVLRSDMRLDIRCAIREVRAIMDKHNDDRSVLDRAHANLVPRIEEVRKACVRQRFSWTGANDDLHAPDGKTYHMDGKWFFWIFMLGGLVGICGILCGSQEHGGLPLRGPPAIGDGRRDASDSDDDDDDDDDYDSDDDDSDSD